MPKVGHGKQQQKKGCWGWFTPFRWIHRIITFPFTWVSRQPVIRKIAALLLLALRKVFRLLAPIAVPFIRIRIPIIILVGLLFTVIDIVTGRIYSDWPTFLTILLGHMAVKLVGCSRFLLFIVLIVALFLIAVYVGELQMVIATGLSVIFILLALKEW